MNIAKRKNTLKIIITDKVGNKTKKKLHITNTSNKNKYYAYRGNKAPKIKGVDF